MADGFGKKKVSVEEIEGVGIDEGTKVTKPGKQELWNKVKREG